MPVESDPEILEKRALLTQLAALSAIPAAPAAKEPAAVAAGLADALIGLLRLDFAFVRLFDSGGAGAVDASRGTAWKRFPESLERHLATSGRRSGTEIIRDVGDALERRRGVVVPIGEGARGGVVAAASDRPGFPTESEQLVLSVVAQHAAIAAQTVRLLHERAKAEEALREARDELEVKVAERTAELRRSEAYLAEAQSLTRTGAFAVDVSTGELANASPEEHARLFGLDPEHGVPSREEFLQLVHPEDRAACAEELERAIREAAGFDIEYRLALPQTPLKHFRAIAHPVFTASGELAELVGTVMDVTEQKRAAQERQAQLWFLESIDAINRAMQRTRDVEQMMGDVLDAVLAIFSCDRAWLIYPCDPDAPSHRVRMERTRPDHVGASGLGLEVPNDAEMAGLFRSVLTSDRPIRFDPESGRALPPATAERFRIRSQIVTAVYPKLDRPYMFGLHQCSHPRVWTSQEERLFQAVGARLADALDALLMFRNVRESERRLDEAQRITHVGYWDRDLVTDCVALSDEAYRIFGLRPQERPMNLAGVEQLIHPEDRHATAEAVAEALRGGSRHDVEYRVVRPDGDVRIVHGQGDVIADESGRPRRMFGTVQDVTERRQAEQLLEDLAGRLINAQEAERRRVGRELHDHVSQMLTVLTMKISELRTDPAVAPGVAAALDALRQDASDIADDVRGLSHRLHSSMLDHGGLAPALTKLVADFSSGQTLSIEFAHASIPAAVPSDVALCLFRVAEEALSNVVKHSQARSARVRVDGGSDGMHLSVEDDGTGFDVQRLTGRTGLGFVSMQERLRALGGTVRVDSAPSRGTTIDVWVPSTSAARG